MLSLPTLAPRDSHLLWYSSSSSNPSQHVESASNAFDHLATNTNPGPIAGPHPHRRQHTHHRTPLSRLRSDEEHMERRKQNVQNYGNSWIKPPGIPKSLHQLREEKREMEEHQEALRREALAQELAEAEAEADGADDLLQGEGMEGEMEEVRDLDDEVPEAETTGLDAEESEPDDLDNEIEEVPRGVLASRMPDDVYREVLVRGDEMRTTRFGDDGGSTIDEDDQAQMLQEEDLIHETRNSHQDEMDLDMDADLDDDIPEAETGGYEHTDTEDELSTSEAEDDDNDESLDAGHLPQRYPVATSMVRSDGTQNSLDLSSMISRDGSSQNGSSPHQINSLQGRRGG